MGKINYFLFSIVKFAKLLVITRGYFERAFSLCQWNAMTIWEKNGSPDWNRIAGYCKETSQGIGRCPWGVKILNQQIYIYE